MKGFIGVLLSLIILSCTQNTEKADLLILNGNVLTLDEENPTASAIAVKNGKILAVGTDKEVAGYQHAQSQVIDAEGRFVMPGLIEGHGHFAGLGRMLLNPYLLDTKNWDEILEIVDSSLAHFDSGEWMIGRGWHQEKWNSLPEHTVDGYPTNADLSAISPDNPVILEHASGHGIIANDFAMQKAGIQMETTDPVGGHIIRDDLGKPTGVFEEKAENLIKQSYATYLKNLSEEEKYKLWKKIIEKAESECLKNGITSFQDAGNNDDDLTGTRIKHLEYYRRYASEGELDLRLYVMMRDSNHIIQQHTDRYPLIGAYNDKLTIRCVKKQVDGALGSYGAWLLEPYNDRKNFYGQNTHPLSELIETAALCSEHNLQMAVHAIGDRANREILDMYELHNGEGSEDKRWRIEHAQHLHPDDIPRFGKQGIIASVQAVHCTSDAPFVEKRLGKIRSESGAYPWRSLLDSGAKIANGTDAPVERINPFESLYASVSRTRTDNGLIFYSEQSMTRKEAIVSYTMGNAFAAFEENLKGSLEPGKLADIVILDTDIMQCPAEELVDTKVLYTLVGGEIKYKVK